jgi:hypothetical protein
MKSVVIENFLNENYEFVNNLYKFNKRKDGYITFPIFAVYENPVDFPNKYVVRLWQINRKIGQPIATRYCVIKDTLEECREAIPPHLYRFGKDSSDDPQIVETWI